MDIWADDDCLLLELKVSVADKLSPTGAMTMSKIVMHTGHNDTKLVNCRGGGLGNC